MSSTHTKKLVGQLFNRVLHRPKKSAVPVYLKRFRSIDALIEAGMLSIDLRELRVAIDVSVHMLYMDDDRKYAAFFENLRAYINFRRGFLSLEFVEADRPVCFAVTIREEIRYDLEKGEFHERPVQKYHVILNGVNVSGKVDYQPSDTSEENHKTDNTDNTE